MIRLYYTLRILGMIVPKVGGAISSLVRASVVSVAVFWRSLLDSSQMVSENMFPGDPNGEVSRVISFIIATLIWVFMAHITVWFVGVLRSIF